MTKSIYKICTYYVVEEQKMDIIYLSYSHNRTENTLSDILLLALFFSFFFFFFPQMESIYQHNNLNIIQKIHFTNLPGLYSTFCRNHWICAAGFASATMQVSVKSWFSRTSTFELCEYPWISIDDGGAVKIKYTHILFINTQCYTITHIG